MRKKLYPRNASMRFALNELEKKAIEQAAAREDVSPSDWVHRRLWNGSLRSAVASSFPEDIQVMESERSSISTEQTVGHPTSYGGVGLVADVTVIGFTNASNAYPDGNGWTPSDPEPEPEKD